MNEGLFKKYEQQILSRISVKQKVIADILEKTGIQLNESEIAISKKTVVLSTSSTRKAVLLQKGCKEALKNLGYALQG